MTIDPTAINPDASLIRIARNALALDDDPGKVPWESIDLNDPEQRRFGDYELLSLLGRGGMGVVYRAHQKSLDREVAIKFIAASIADDAAYVARFLGEAQAAARLNHPNIVPVYEVGTVDCLHYFSMPLLGGQTLADVLDAKVLSVQESVALIRKLCSAVAYAHSLGLLHLDLKPANVMLDERGEPLVGDFGLARRMDGRGGVDAQEVSGTPAYMAPEQIQIRQFRLTAATDLYALGAILYRLLTGKAPHGQGTPQQLMQNAIAGRIAPVVDLAPAVPKDLAAICMACLHLHAEDRYPTVAALADDLARFADGNPVSVRQPGLLERFSRVVRRHPGASLATGVAIAALAIGFATATWQWGVAESARAEAAAHAARQQKLAALLANSMDERADGGHARVWGAQADRIVDWLHANEPDPAQQAALLKVFVVALREAGKEDIVDRLSWAIPDRLGRDYRRALGRELAARHDADSMAVALMLSLRRAADRDDDPDVLALVDRALDVHPGKPLVMVSAAMVCASRRDGCGDRPVQARMEAVSPGKLLVLLHGARGEIIDSERLARMAATSEVGDPLPALIGLLQKALVDFTPPPSVLLPMTAIMDEGEARAFIQREAIATLPTPEYPLLLQKCDPALPHMTEGDRPNCLSVARRMFQADSASIITRMIGSVMLRRLAPDTAESAGAIDFRRQYIWLREQGVYEAISGPHLAAFDRDTAALGEWPAMLQQARRLGVRLQPPADWVPQNPEDLLLPEQRGRR